MPFQPRMTPVGGVSSYKNIDLDLLIDSYVINDITGSIIRFKLLPDEVSESYSAEFEDVPIMGRSSPYVSYSLGGPKEISLSLILHDDYCIGGNILDTVNKFKALAYPNYEDQVIEPPKCFLRIGDFIKLLGVCSSVDVSWEKPIRVDKDTGESFYAKADVSLSLRNVVKVPFSADQVERGNDSDRLGVW